MTLNNRKNAFISLGKKLKMFSLQEENNATELYNNDVFYTDFKQAIDLAQHKNGWFTEENIRFACQSWADALTEENLNLWLNSYNFDKVQPKRILLIMAGNIPLVGFHDFLSVLISGHSVVVKLSSNDNILLPVIARYLQNNSPEFKNKIEFSDSRIAEFDAVIATGSNNTARYFEYYFSKKPHIIRKNRNSVAILTGEESEEKLKALGEDIFKYFGLGCRSVSKIFVPENYDFTSFFKAIYDFHPIIEYKKYENNYDYNKAVYLMSLFKLQENGFLILKEDDSYASPIATLFYEYYDSLNNLRKKLESDKEKIQCIVSEGFIENEIPFGKTQTPNLTDYADNVDTLKFLINL